MDVNYKLLLEQDPELKEFCKDIIFEVMLKQGKELDTMIATIHNFYMIGNSKEQVIKFFVSMGRMMGDKQWTTTPL